MRRTGKRPAPQFRSDGMGDDIVQAFWKSTASVVRFRPAALDFFIQRAIICMLFDVVEND